MNIGEIRREKEKRQALRDEFAKTALLAILSNPSIDEPEARGSS